MLTTNIILTKGKIFDLFSQHTPANLETSAPLNKDDRWWIKIDLGKNQDKVINYVRARHKSPFGSRRTFLQASHDGTTWKRVGYLTMADMDRAVPGTKDWHTLNFESFRYYRILIDQGESPIKGKNLPQLQLGFEGRNLISPVNREVKLQVPLLRFRNRGLTKDKRYYIFSYYLPRSQGIDFSTEPSQQFAYNYSINMASDVDKKQTLSPTWQSNWHSDNLFQIGYKADGVFSVNIPSADLIKYRKKIININLKTSHTGIKVLDYGADSLRVEVNQPKASWLYYADTWDKHWESTVNKIPSPTLKANLQFKAVYVPKGKQIVELAHKPKPFINLVILTYTLQFLLILSVFYTKKSKVST